MSFFRHKRKKIKYEALPSERDKENDGIIVCQGFSLEAVNLYINNFVSPRDGHPLSKRKLSARNDVKSKSWDVVSTRAAPESFQAANIVSEARKNATFMRLKRKLENIKNFYPDVYYSKESIIEMWARHNELYQINLEILDYDRDSPAWMWI
ncbi:hypothetical protein MTP99_013556 [Tenebrio molitor]|jgi:hypothetical protein|uniref:uncharacterized protein n=1 Tax=Tenebrio molitor TaxID=7067 RepID=UPI001C3A8607|nr:hypothetical protein MTP99_013556 [Tenebrio molitor]CAH1372064.1 unnamed protein product [Tenebrio molitor]